MKPKKKRKTYKTINRSPGTVLYQGQKQSNTTAVDVINYCKGSYHKFESQQIEDAFNFKGQDQVTWINVNGLNNTSEIEKLGKHYGLHPLTLEDIVNTTHRPKIDEYENYIFIVLKMLYYHKDDELVYEQVSLVLGASFVLTFQEADGDVFNDLRERIASGKGRSRDMGADYLMYTIIDAIVDHYLTIVDVVGDMIEELEDKVFNGISDTDETPNIIQTLKREILKIRRSVFPVREVISHLEKTDHIVIHSKTHSFLKDLYDHIIQVNENIEMYREMVRGLLEMHMTLMSNKMNEVMKMLTIIATIFIPLTFIAGIYGMNFDNMPELHYRYSYFILLGIMVIMVMIMLIYFRKKKWL